MSEFFPDDADLLALVEDDRTGVPFIETGKAPYYLEFRQMLWRLLANLAPLGCRVCKTGELAVRVKPGRYWLAGELHSFAGSEADVVLTDDATNRVWIGEDGAVHVDADWPTGAGGEHVKLAEVVTAGGGFDFADLADLRGASCLGSLASALTATPAEINAALDGASVDVTAANLSELTGGGETALHSHAGGGGLTEIVEDLTPQLGGDLDVNGKQITSASNGPVAIIPNGSGAIVARATGNARGYRAIDLQRAASLDSQVASGVYSFIAGGENNTASHDDTFATGMGSTASGGTAFACGYATTASGSCSHAQNEQTVASGNHSHAEGLACVASGNKSHAQGAASLASLEGQDALGYAFDQGPNNWIVGSAQATRFVMRGATANDTPLALEVPEEFALADEKTYDVLLRVVARRDTGEAHGSVLIHALIEQTGGTVTLLDSGQVYSSGAIAATTWSVAVTADDTNKLLKVTVTGASGTNVRWVAMVEAVEVAYAD